MNYKILSIPEFDRQLKRLSKKFPSLKSEIAELAKTLLNDPHYGTSIGKQCYKIGCPLLQKQKGKAEVQG